MSPRKPRPPTHLARGKFWSCHGSGRFGDTLLWGTRGSRGARGWDASAIPPRVGLRLPLFDVFFYRVVFSAALLCGEGGSGSDLDDWGPTRAHKRCRSSSGSVVRFITQRAATHQCSSGIAFRASTMWCKERTFWNACGVAPAKDVLFRNGYHEWAVSHHVHLDFHPLPSKVPTFLREPVRSVDISSSDRCSQRGSARSSKQDPLLRRGGSAVGSPEAAAASSEASQDGSMSQSVVVIGRERLS